MKERKQNVKKKNKKNKNKQNNKIYICKICGKELNVDIDHFKSKEHINDFNKNIAIRTKKSTEKKFIDIIFKFKITTKNFIIIYILKRLQNKKSEKI